MAPCRQCRAQPGAMLEIRLASVRPTPLIHRVNPGDAMAETEMLWLKSNICGRLRPERTRLSRLRRQCWTPSSTCTATEVILQVRRGRDRQGERQAARCRADGPPAHPRHPRVVRRGPEREHGDRCLRPSPGVTGQGLAVRLSYVPEHFWEPDVLGRENHEHIGRGFRLRHLVARPLLGLADVRSSAATRAGESWAVPGAAGRVAHPGHCG